MLKVALDFAIFASKSVCAGEKFVLTKKKNEKVIKTSTGNEQIVAKSQVVVANAQIQMWQHVLPMNGTDNGIGLHWHRIRSTKTNTRQVQTTTELQQYFA